jgi:hypothetical protein
MVLINLAAKAVEQLPGAGVGFVVGAFTPSIGRKIKALFVKESKVVESKVISAEASVAKKL